MPARRQEVEIAHDWATELEVSQVQQNERIMADVLSKVDVRFDHPMTDGEIEEITPILRAAIERQIPDDPAHVSEVLRGLVQQMRGYGPLEPLFLGEDARDITEIQITPVREGAPRVFVVRHGQEEPWPSQIFSTDSEVHNWVRRVADTLGITWNEQHPIADLWLDDGSRINAVGFKVNPFSAKATIVTIRKSPAFVAPVPMERMVELNSLDQEMADLLVLAVVKGRRNALFCGPTDSAKTSMMRALAQFIDPADHVAVVETSWEVYLPHLPNAVNFVEVRNAGQDVVTAADIGKALLRQNFKRAIFGEVRGAEIQPAFDEMQSVAGGCFTTIHAWSIHSLIERVVTTFGYARRTVTAEEAKSIICTTFDIVVFMDKDKDKRRRVTAIYEAHESEGFRLLYELDIETDSYVRRNKLSPEFVKRVRFAGGEIPEGLMP